MLKNIPPVTRNLLIITLLCYLAQIVLEMRGVDLVELFGLHFALARDFRFYQLATYLFLHGSFVHLFFNMFSLWMFGRIIESTISSRRFIVYYFVCGIGAGLCQELWQTGQYFISSMAQYDYANISGVIVPMDIALNAWNTIGASGACYGILLAFGMFFPEERLMLLFPPIPLKAKYFVIGYAVIEVLSAFFSNGNIAHFAHLGGMLFGWLLLVYWRKQNRRCQWQEAEEWPPRRQSLWMQIKTWWNSRHFSSKQQAKKADDQEVRFKDRNDDYEFNARQREREARMDKILDKVKRSGYSSLTQEEKDELFRNSRR